MLFRKYITHDLEPFGMFKVSYVILSLINE